MPEHTTCPVCNAQLSASDTTCGRCGYKLQGQTEQIPCIDTTMKQDVFTAQPNKTGNPTLTIIKGPSEGQKFKLTKFPMIIGRDPASDLFLNNTTVTRKHASIDIIGNEVIITDLHSLNGTWVNGKICDSAVLTDGTIVQIGTFTMMFGA